MNIGVAYWPTDESIPVTEFAVALEERGFESFFVGDHTHVPVLRETPYRSSQEEYPGIASLELERGEIPHEYKRMLPPLIVLAMAAVVTHRIKLGTAITLVAQRDPILTAKEVATIDRYSGGRLLLGVGFGWSVEEMANHGVDASHRHAIVREKVAAMKVLWTHEEASYEGRYVRLSPTWLWPKPLQQPHVPILIGGDGPIAMKHAVEYGDGWIPVAGNVVEKMKELRRIAGEAGRDPSTLPVTVTSPRPNLQGLEHYRQAGVRRVVLWVPPPYGRDSVLPVLDDWAGLVSRMAG